MIVEVILMSVLLAGAAAAYQRRKRDEGRPARDDLALADVHESDPSDEPEQGTHGRRERGDLALADVRESEPHDDESEQNTHGRRERDDLALVDPGVAQVQDHQRGPGPKQTAVALADLHERDPVIYRWELDGGTSWRIKAPPDGWSIYPVLTRAIAARRSAIELFDPHGKPVAVRLRREGQRVVLQTSATRIDLQAQVAEIAVTAQAIETEGIGSWYLRELPRALWWLIGEDVSQAICRTCIGRAGDGCERCNRGRRPWPSWQDLADELARHGLEQHRIEQAMDQGGLELVPGLEDALLADGLTVKGFVPRPGARSGIAIGDSGRHPDADKRPGSSRRRRNPQTMAIYDKCWEIRAKRADREALIEAMEAAGWSPGKPWVRLDVRTQGEGLVLVQDGEVVVDGRHPGAALDERVRAALWRHVLGRIWLADTRSSASRARDKGVSPLWVRLRDFAAPVLDESARITMISRAAKRQLASVAEKAAERLGKAAIDVGVARGGRTLADVAEIARAELEAQLEPAVARERLTAARARYQSLLDAAAAQVEQQNTNTNARTTP